MLFTDIEDIEDIKALIQKNPSRGDLDFAAEHERELKLYTEDVGKQIIFDVVRQRLMPDAFAIFKREYKNPCISLYSHISEHFAKVYDAHGSVFSIDFGNKINTEARFRELRKIAYGANDSVFWRRYGHDIIIKEPNSVFVTGRIGADIKIKHYPLSQIKAVDTDIEGIKWIVLEDAENYFCYDSQNVWTVSKDFETYDFIEHGAIVCPVTWASNDCMFNGNYNIRKSVLSDKVRDGSLMHFLINSNTMAYYKAKSAFDTKVRPQGEEEVLKIEQLQRQASDPDHELSHEQMMLRIKSIRDNDPDMMGGTIKISPARLTDSVFVDAIIGAIQNIPANVDSLRYHDEYLGNTALNILNSVTGADIGIALQNRAVNQEQVAANVDGKERTLKEFGSNVEGTWNFTLSRLGEILTNGNKFTAYLKLGERYFLKSEELLLRELEQLLKGTSNLAAIEQKQSEIYLTKNRHNPKALERYNLIKLLQPLAALPQSYISDHRMALNPDVVSSYENFPQVLAIFEVYFGSIENFATQEDTLAAKYKLIKVEFDKIEQKLYGTTTNTQNQNVESEFE